MTKKRGDAAKLQVPIFDGSGLLAAYEEIGVALAGEVNRLGYRGRLQAIVAIVTEPIWARLQGGAPRLRLAAFCNALLSHGPDERDDGHAALASAEDRSSAEQI